MDKKLNNETAVCRLLSELTVAAPASFPETISISSQPPSTLYEKKRDFRMWLRYATKATTTVFEVCLNQTVTVTYLKETHSRVSGTTNYKFSEYAS